MKYFLILFCLSTIINAQDRKEGTIFLNNGDNLTGFVTFSTVYAGIQRKNPRVFYWKKLDGKKQTFRAVEVDSIFVGNETIYSILVDKPCKKMFFRVLCQGKNPLVIFNMVHAGGPNFGFINSGSTEYWVWKKKPDKAYPMKTRYSTTVSFKTRIRNYLMECPKLTSDYKLKELKKMEAIKLYKLYNSCIE